MNILLRVVPAVLLSWAPGFAAIRVEDVPENGLQPEVVVAEDGTAHLVYLRGDPKAADVRYTWRKAGQPWRPGVTVNSAPGSAIAVGTIRGAQVALGGGSAVHVLWNGTGARAPLGYARKPGGTAGFEPQRDLLGDTLALDGGASIAADGKGSVYAVWHAGEAGGKPGEDRRLVFVRTSRDEGRTFGKPDALNRMRPGVCACCSLRALAGPDSPLRVFFRSASTLDNRVMTLVSGPGDASPPREVEPWKTGTCPMSSTALVGRQKNLLGAWETAGTIRAAWISDPAFAAVTVASKEAKHPALAINAGGNVLAAWVEGSGWNRGGTVAWRELDAQLKPAGERREAGRVPAWGKVAAYAEPGGDFVLLR